MQFLPLKILKMTSTKNFINISNKYDRVVVLVDMDCFYCQVEEKLNPSLEGKPIAVVQCNAWRGGGIIAVNYPARAKGVTRHMRGDEAKEQCPDIEPVRVPSLREKADLTKYRKAGKEVAAVLRTFTSLLERASIDEAYLDITEQVVCRLNTMDKGEFHLKPEKLVNTHVVGYEHIGSYIQQISTRIEDGSLDDLDDYESSGLDLTSIQKSDIKLLIGASIVSEIRAAVKEKTGYECSAGIAHNKILAKLACGLNKPNKQTILPLRQITHLFSILPVGKIKGLGGKFGEDVCEILRIKFLGDLLSFSEKELQKKFDEKSGSWLYLLARGIDLEAITPRFYSKSIGCKKFHGRTAITGLNSLTHWLSELSKEICDRIEIDSIENNRRAKQMVVSFIQEINGEDISNSRSSTLPGCDPEVLSKLSLDIIKKNTDRFFKSNTNSALNNPIKFLGISVGKFESLNSKNTLQKMFLKQAKKKTEKENSSDDVLKQSDDVTSEGTQLTQSRQIQGFAQNTFSSSVKNNQNISNYENSEAEKSVNSSKLPEKRKNTESMKSFFMNAIKRKSSNENSEIIQSTSEEITLKLSEEMSNDADNFDFEDKSEQITNEQTETHAINTTLLSDNSNSFHEPSTSAFQEDKQNMILDFSKNYAEYFVPEPNPNDYKDCEKCGKSILVYAMQSHLDFHFAFEVSQEQRQQFREEIKAKIASPPTKKQKSNNTLWSNVGGDKSKAKVLASIDKFLIRGTTQSSEFLIKDSGKEICPECGCLLDISKIAEHIDYHAAKKLQRELNQSENFVSVMTSSIRSNNAKNNAKKSCKTHSNKTIKMFFVSQD